jgi:zinc transport system substrate-binding protein
MTKIMKGMKLFIFNISLLCALLLVINCQANDKPTVFVSIVPQKYFVQQISKDLVKVEVMVQPGASPATYEPKPSQMAGLSSCAAYFTIGVPFENAWLDRISAVNPQMKIVRTDRRIDKIAMARHHHDRGEGEGHDEDYQAGQPILDPHIWLSPALVKKQAAEILSGLTDLLPEHAVDFNHNYRLFLERIDALDNELKALLRDRAGMRFMVFHPSWGYFALDYALEQVPIEIEGKAPKPAQLAELIHQAREHDIRIVFVQPQFSQKNASVVAREIGGKVVVADPLAEDWPSNLRDVADKFNQAMK